MTPKLILFDLGGVVVRWTGIQALSDMTGLSVLEVGQAFGNSEICRDFEIGRCEASTFLDELAKLFDLNLSRSEIHDLWNAWVGAPYDGIAEAIRSLGKEHQIACLSNTNALHWAHLKTYLDPDELFHRAFASHIVHLAKPDAAIYSYVLSELNMAPENVIFLDDTQANIDAARMLGINSFKVDPKLGALPVLQRLDLFPKQV